MIAAQSNIKRLFLNNNPIVDSGLVHLKGLDRLEWLELGKTKISDAGLRQLKAQNAPSSLQHAHTQPDRCSAGNFPDWHDVIPMRSIIW
ncbi:MAG: hypothetical protein R3C59_21890 [Planctomycetaceae bacterium]